VSQIENQKAAPRDAAKREDIDFEFVVVALRTCGTSNISMR